MTHLNVRRPWSIVPPPRLSSPPRVRAAYAHTPPTHRDAPRMPVHPVSRHHVVPCAPPAVSAVHGSTDVVSAVFPYVVPRRMISPVGRPVVKHIWRLVKNVGVAAIGTSVALPRSESE
eukprot:385486-Amorphochlora_amoeboformis.AAC.2